MHPRLQRIITGSLFAGLEIQFLAGGMALHLVVLKQKGHELVIEKSVNNIESLDKLSNHLVKDIPIAVAFTGKGILHRRIAIDPAGDPKMFLSKILPNASLKEFYLQTVPAVQDEQFVSLLRKSSADEIIEQLQQKQFSVVECSLGPLALINILPLLEQVDDELKFGNHSILIRDSFPEEISFSEEISEKKIVLIGTQKIEAESLLAFAVAFQQLFSGDKHIEAKVESLISAKEDFLRKKIFKTGGKSLLIFVFLVLLGNYFAFSHYWSEKNELESRVQTDGGALTKVREIEKQVEVKKSFLQQAGLLGFSRDSYYADQIAAELPNEIRLSCLNIAPRIKLSEEDTIGFQTGRVEIDGSCSQSVVLNKWLQKLKTDQWVKNATLESYLQDKTMTQGEFEVFLELK
jgi:Tfp pilus assembly protein PilN